MLPTGCCSRSPGPGCWLPLLTADKCLVAVAWTALRPSLRRTRPASAGSSGRPRPRRALAAPPRCAVSVVPHWPTLRLMCGPLPALPCAVQQWLAKEFAKERTWKLKQAKRAVVAVQRSNLDLESRVLVRQREEEKSIRKRAAWIAKEVRLFASHPQHKHLLLFCWYSGLFSCPVRAPGPPAALPSQAVACGCRAAHATRCGGNRSPALLTRTLRRRSWRSGTRLSAW